MISRENKSRPICADRIVDRDNQVILQDFVLWKIICCKIWAWPLVKQLDTKRSVSISLTSFSNPTKIPLNMWQL